MGGILISLALLAILAGVALGIVGVGKWIGERLFGTKQRSSPPIGKVSDLTADWSWYARYLGRTVPKGLIDHYAGDRPEDWGTYDGLEFTFRPIGPDELLDTADELGFDLLPFAMTDSGDPIFLKPGAKERNAVYVLIHDDPEEGPKRIAASLSAFLRTDG